MIDVKRIANEYSKRSGLKGVDIKCTKGLLHVTVEEEYEFRKDPCGFFELKSIQSKLHRNGILMVKITFLCNNVKYVRVNVLEEDSYETYLRIRDKLKHERCSFYSGSNSGGCVDGHLMLKSKRSIGI